MIQQYQQVILRFKSTTNKTLLLNITLKACEQSVLEFQSISLCSVEIYIYDKLCSIIKLQNYYVK